MALLRPHHTHARFPRATRSQACVIAATAKVKRDHRCTCPARLSLRLSALLFETFLEFPLWNVEHSFTEGNAGRDHRALRGPEFRRCRRLSFLVRLVPFPLGAGRAGTWPAAGIYSSNRAFNQHLLPEWVGCLEHCLAFPEC